MLSLLIYGIHGYLDGKVGDKFETFKKVVIVIIKVEMVKEWIIDYGKVGKRLAAL